MLTITSQLKIKLFPVVLSTALCLGAVAAVSVTAGSLRKPDPLPVVAPAFDWEGFVERECRQAGIIALKAQRYMCIPVSTE